MKHDVFMSFTDDLWHKIDNLHSFTYDLSQVIMVFRMRHTILHSLHDDIVVFTNS